MAGPSGKGAEQVEDERGIFGFEDSFAEDLRFMPLSMRYRLDLSGLKLRLEDWHRLPVAARERLLRMPVGDEGDIASFREAAIGVAASHGCRWPAEVQPVDRSAWDARAGIPEQVLAACARIPAEPPLEAWPGLPDFRRYALYKLACSGREPGAFAAALREIVDGRSPAEGRRDQPSAAPTSRP